jgi:nitroimidazol reductase NimA-like FMN-containing flavoprotein (pyridoxamine 5'-phosphate oxidase superfamily)
MRKQNQQISDKEIIEAILQKSKIIRIAMMDGNRPYILPFNYGYSDNCIYIHSAPEGKKLDLLRQENHVCFEIEQVAEIVPAEAACKWATTYRSVVGYGSISILNDFRQKQEALKIIMSHNGATGNQVFEKKQVEYVVILKLAIDEITGKQSGNLGKSNNQAEIVTNSNFQSLLGWNEDEKTTAMNDFARVGEELKVLVSEWYEKLLALPEDTISENRNSQNRNIRQIVGHLADSASNNTHRIIHLHYGENPNRFPDYANLGNNERWITIQHYDQEDWETLLGFWRFCNIHLIHLIKNIDREKLQNEWVTALDQKVSLYSMVMDYPRHFKLHLNEISELMSEEN